MNNSSNRSELDKELATVLGLKHSSVTLPELEPSHFEYVREQGDQHQKIIIFPQLHDQVIFSKIAFRILNELKPSLVALELPGDLVEYLNPAIDRLPISTLIHDGNLQTNFDITFPPPPASSYIVHPGEALFWLAYLARRSGYSVDFIDTWHPKAYASWVVPVDFPALASIGWKKFWELSVLYIQKHVSNLTHLLRSLNMADRLVKSSDQHSTILFACGAAHWPIIDFQLDQAGFKLRESNIIPIEITDYIRSHLLEKPIVSPDQETKKWYLADIHPHSLHLVTSDLPFVIASMVYDPQEFDLLDSFRNIYFEAEKNYKHQFEDTISPASYRRLFQYLRNLNRLKGQPLPGLIDIITAAKGMGDDDFAFEVYRTAVIYPFIATDENRMDQMVKFAPDEKKGEVIKFAFKRRFRRPILRKLRKDEYFEDFDPIPEENFSGEWQEIWDKYSTFGMVSYPPEDVFIEGYLTFLRKRINEIIMEEQATSIEFKTSLEDGIDWRATTRHYHEGKVFVKKIPRKQPEIGAMIVQFLEEPIDELEYGYHSTLFAEHDQESHISIITTTPGDIMVGPGITRVKYAAIISQFPPVGMPALIPKTNEDLKIRLIYAAMSMSLSKIIGFVAPRPPSAAHRHFAATNGFRVVYLPMSQLTKASMHRLRTMHLLAHRSLRDIAREYIGF